VLRGEHLLPRLVDFGLAKLAERGGPSETGTRQILGTPKYMAPEQAQARREDIGPPADVYALGVILYEMIAGRAPYDGATDVEVLRQAVEGKPVAPRVLRPDVPRDLEAICLKAMALTTTERYRTAIDFADDLRRFLEGRPTVARPLAWSGRAYRWLRRNDQIVAIVVLAIIAIFVTSLATWNSYQSRQLRKDHDTVLSEQAKQNRAEQERVYSRNMQDAFLAWRAGNSTSAAGALEVARRSSNMLMEQPDFTYDYLARLLKTERLMIVCPAGPVTALAASPDGTRLASGHSDGTLTLWDRSTGIQLGTVQAHEGEISHVAFALGGTLIFTVGKGKNSAEEALGWSASKSGTLAPAPDPHRTLATNGKSVCCLAIPPDGKVVYAGGENGRLFKIHLTDPKRTIALPGRADQPRISAIAVSPSGKCVWTATPAGTVRSWSEDLVVRPEHEKIEFDRPVTALAATEGDWPAVGFATGGYYVTRPTRPTGSTDPNGSAGSAYHTPERVHWLVIGPSGNLALNSVPGRVLIDGRTDLATGDTGDVRAGAFSPDGQTLFTGSRDGVIRAWDVVLDARERGTSAAGPVAAVGVSSDGSQAVVVDNRLTRYLGPRAAELVEGGPRPLVAVQILEESVTRGVALGGNTVLVSDITGKTSTERLRVVVPDGRTATTAVLTADGSRVAVGDDIGRVTVWSIADRAVQGTIDTGLRRPVRRIALSPDGRRVAAPTVPGLSMWALGIADPVLSIPTDDQAVFCFLPGERFATAGRDGVVRVWSSPGKEDQMLFGHVGRVTGLNISPDGRTLVSGGATGEVKFWDLRTGQELLSIRRHSTAVTVIEFAAGGKVLVTAGDGQIAVWDARGE
jgi:WD40 repeat protein